MGKWNMDHGQHRVCPVAIAGFLDNRIRRWVQDPHKILSPYVKEGMTVLDFGCGPGHFAVHLARLVGKSGRVFAADLQEGMLQKVRDKIRGTDLESRITLHKTGEHKIGLAEKVDLVLAFYVVHEVPDQSAFFAEVQSVLKPDGSLLMTEPPFAVSKKAFEEAVSKAVAAGFVVAERPKVPLSKAVVLKKSEPGKKM